MLKLPTAILVFHHLQMSRSTGAQEREDVFFINPFCMLKVCQLVLNLWAEAQSTVIKMLKSTCTSLSLSIKINC